MVTTRTPPPPTYSDILKPLFKTLISSFGTTFNGLFVLVLKGKILILLMPGFKIKFSLQ